MKKHFLLSLSLAILFASVCDHLYATTNKASIITNKLFKPTAVPSTYFVNSATGSDSRTTTQAQSSSTPWLTISKAITSAAAGDIIMVQGSFTEKITVNKSLSLIGVNTGTTKATLSTPSTNVTNGSILTVSAFNVSISNFAFDLNLAQTKYIACIFSSVDGNTNSTTTVTTKLFDGLSITGCDFYSTPSNANSTTFTDNYSFGTYAVYLKGASSNTNTDAATFKGNTVGPKTPATPVYFGRALRIVNATVAVGGANASDGNNLKAYYTIQYGAPRKAINIQNNTLDGFAEFYLGNVNGFTIQNNTFQNTHFVKEFFWACLETKHVDAGTTAGTHIITNNTFSGYAGYGLALDKANDVTVTNNSFTPADTSKYYTDIAINTKLSTTQTFPVESFSGITIQGNSFNGGSVVGGTAVYFSNHNGSASVTPYSNVTIGGAGSLANTFAANHKMFIGLDGKTGLANSDPLWANQGNAASNMVPTKFNLTANQNTFGLSTGSKLPSAMTTADLFEMEDKIQHGTDYGQLGNVFFSSFPNNVYVSANSYYLPYTTYSTPQNAIDASTGSSIIVVNSSTFTRQISVSNNVTIDGIGTISFDSLTVSSGKTLKLGKPLTVNKSFVLTSGKINNNGNKLSVKASILPAGSASAYIITDTLGTVEVSNAGNSQFTFPIGTSTAYAPVTFKDANNTTDVFSAWVKDVTDQSKFYPALPSTVPAFVTKEWQINEGTAGGSNAAVTFGWTSASESNPPLNQGLVTTHYVGNQWLQKFTTYNTGTVITSGLTAQTSFGKYAVYSFQKAAQITSFAPLSGKSGDTITIKGFAFTGASAVKFGGFAASNFIVKNDTTIKAVLSSNGGSGTVLVQQSFGALTDTGFAYVAVIDQVVVSNTTGCGGTNATVSFRTTGAYNTGNVFNVQITNEQGGGAWTTIGSGTSSPVVVTIPLKAKTGDEYYFRVVASDPAQTSNTFVKSTAQYTLTTGYNPSVTVTQTTVTPECAGGVITFLATLTDASPSSSYKWTLNGGELVNSGLTYSSNTLSNGDVVGVTLTNNASCTFGPATGTATVSGIGAACAAIWTGANGTDWNTAGNWKNGTLPTATTSALVPNTTNKPVISSTASVGSLTVDPSTTVSGSGTLTITGNLTNNGTFAATGLTVAGTASLKGTAFTLSTLDLTSAARLTLATPVSVTSKVTVATGSNFASNGNLRLKSSSSGTAYIDGLSSSYQLTGDINVERALTGSSRAGMHQIGSMVNNFNVGKLLTAANASVYFEFFDEATNSWSHTTSSLSSISVPAGQNSFGFQAEGSSLLTFTGTAFYQDLTLSMTRGVAVGTISRGFNNYSNPYPKPLSWAKVVADNGGSSNPNTFFTLWVWNPGVGNYATVTFAGVTANGGKDVIDIGQGFLVRRSTVGTGPVFTLKYSQTVTPTGSTFLRKASPANILRLKLSAQSDNQYSDEAVVFTADEAITGEDANDGAKLYSLVSAPGISTGDDMAINALPTGFEGVQPLNLVVPESGKYNLEVNELSGLNVRLEDKQTGNLTNLNGATTLTLDLNKGDKDRFALHFGNAANTVAESNVKIYAANKEVTILLPATGNAEVEVVNSLGQVVKTVRKTDANVIRFDLQHDGIYTIRVRHEGGITTGKVIY